MPSVLATLAIGATLVLAAAASPAAEPWFSSDELSPNGEVSRRLWKPGFASTQAGAVRLSAGVALGLRGSLRQSLDRRATPALVLALREGSSLALLPASDRTMLVWSQPIR